MRWSFRQKREGATATEHEVGNNSALVASVPTGASVDERAAVGEARVAAADGSGFSANRVVDLFPEERGVPEVEGRDLSAACVASALHHHGSLVVRGLLDEGTVTRVRAHLHPDSLRVVVPVSAEVEAMVAGVASAYESSGLVRVVRDYLEEPPVADAARIVVRRVSRETPVSAGTRMDSSTASAPRSAYGHRSMTAVRRARVSASSHGGSTT